MKGIGSLIRCHISVSFLALILVTFTFTTLQFAFGGGKSPYQSGYDHGCDDADISDPDDRYINQPEKGPSFHTDEFMDGYNDGYDSCSDGSSNGSRGNSGTGDCYDEGYQDGLDEPFSQDNYNECRQGTGTAIDNPYYSGFVDGCQAANPHLTEFACEGFAD